MKTTVVVFTLLLPLTALAQSIFPLKISPNRRHFVFQHRPGVEIERTIR